MNLRDLSGQSFPELNEYDGAEPLRNALERLPVPPQGACQHRVEPQTLASPVLAQAMRLSMPKRAELIVIVGSKGGLSVAHEVEGSHRRILEPMCLRHLSQKRRMLWNQKRYAVVPRGSALLATDV